MPKTAIVVDADPLSGTFEIAGHTWENIDNVEPHPTCARPDGTAWCGHASRVGRHGWLDCGLWSDRGSANEYSCETDPGDYCSHHTALAANPTEE